MLWKMILSEINDRIFGTEEMDKQMRVAMMATIMLLLFMLIFSHDSNITVSVDGSYIPAAMSSNE
jgi:hypothetical protein